MRTYLAAAVICLTTLLDAQNIFSVAGIPYTHRNSVDSQPALDAPLNSVYGLLIDKITGRLLFHDEYLVLRYESDGTLLALAGTGPNRQPQLGRFTSGSTLASSLNPGVLRGMAQDATGALYLSDAGAGRVYRVAQDGTVSTFAGGGTQQPNFQSDGGLATEALLASPRGLVFDSKGNLDIAEVFCNCIRQVTPGGIITTLYNLPFLPPSNRIPNVEGLAIDAQDNLYVTEWFGNVVVKVAADGSSATTIAGTGAFGFSGDGGPAIAAQLNGPSGVTLDQNGNVYIADTRNHLIRKVTADGTISTIAGRGTCGFFGDGGPASSAQLCNPAETLFDSSGSLLIADYGNRRVRKMSTDGTITTIAGSGKNDPIFSNTASSGDGGPEIHAAFSLIGGIAFDRAGNLYVSEALGNVIRKISPDGTVSTFAGTGQRGTTGDGGPAIRAELFNPGPLSVGPDGALYVITSDSRVRKITPDGNISLVAGTGTGSGLNRSQGDGGLAVNATLNEPGEVAFEQQGNIYIADTSNARVRKIDKSGIITTVAGPGQQGIDYYNAVAVDPQGNLYVAWTRALPPSVQATVNRVNPDGSLTPVAGTGQPCTGGPGQFSAVTVPAMQARLCAVVGLAVDRNGLLNLSEGGYSLVLRLTANGTIERIAGNTAAVDLGDAGPALEASLAGGQGFSPETVGFDPAGNMYIAEPGLNVIRKVIGTAYKAAVLPGDIIVSGSTAQSQTLTVSGNFDEPFPYAVRVSTADGGSWLTANRVTGLTGESIKVSINPAGLARGSYQGTVLVTVSVPFGLASQAVDIPVSLAVP
jgi:sugar lactone lactonase YvrE